jgi:hypothetical protein
LKFSDQRFFDYDLKFVNGSDLPQIFAITKEWYTRMCPRCEYWELAREFTGNPSPTDVDTLWGEPSDGVKKFGRKLEINAHPKIADQQQIHTRYGLVDKRPDTFQFGVSVLRDLDLWPEVGDLVLWMGNAFEILKVLIKPENRFIHTSIPIHVTCETKRYQMGDQVLSSDGSGGLDCKKFENTEI